MIRPAYKVFNGGIISPLLYHRSDLEIYGRSCKELKNMIPLPTGAVTRRPGTKFLTGTLNNGTAESETRLIPFARSGDVFYLLEFCDKYIRVLFDGLPIELDPAEIDAWDNTKVYNVNEYVKIVNGTDEIIYVAKVANKNKSPLSNPVLWEKTEYYILITPYKDFDVDDLKYIESFDYMYFVHPRHPVYKLINAGLGNMRFERVRFDGNFFNDGNTETYKQVALALDEVNNNPSATTGEYIPGEYYGVDCVIYYDSNFYKAKQNVDYNISQIPPDVNDEYWEAIGSPEHTSGGDTVISTGSMLHLKTKDVDFEDGDHLLIKINNGYANIHEKFDTGDALSATKAILVKGKWNFYTHGIWKGVVEIQRSFDYGITWEKYREFTSHKDANYDINGDEKENGVLYRVYCSEITVDNTTSYPVKIDFVVNEAYFESEGIVRVQNGNTYFQLLNPILAGMVDTDSDAIEDCDTKTYLYAYSAWSQKNGYPETITINEERLCFGGNRRKPMTVWMSRSSDFENLNQGTEATDALAFTLNSETIYPIKFIIPARGLFISTAGDEWILTGSKAGEPISPTSFSARKIGDAGSNGIQGISLGSSIVFVQGDNKTIREMHYDFQIDGYISNNLTEMVDNITESGIKDLTLQKTKWTILWFTRNDGVLIGLTYDPNQKVFAFHKHDTKGKFKRIVSININMDSDVYVECEREIIDASGDIKNVFLIEKFDRLDAPKNHGEINYLDCYVSYTEFGKRPTIEASNILSKTPLEIEIVDFLPNAFFQAVKPENADYRWDDFPYKNEYFRSEPTTQGSFKVRNFLNTNYWSEPDNYCDWEGIALEGKNNRFNLDTHIFGFGELDIIMDGAYEGKVSSDPTGVVYSEKLFTDFIYGYNFTSILEPTNFEIQVGDGSSTGLRKRIIETIIGLYNTVGLNVYAQDGEKMDVIYRMLTENFDNPSELFTGMKKVKFSHGYDRESFMTLVQELPYPATITFLQVWHDAFN